MRQPSGEILEEKENEGGDDDAKCRASAKDEMSDVSALAASLVLLDWLTRANLQRGVARLHGLRRDSLFDFLRHCDKGLFDIRRRFGTCLEERNSHLVRERLQRYYVCVCVFRVACGVRTRAYMHINCEACTHVHAHVYIERERERESHAYVSDACDL